MLSGPEIDDIVERLKEWLEESNELLDDPSLAALESQLSGDRTDDVAPESGLLQLAEAFTAQRHDLKLQAKSVRSLQQEVQSGLDQLAQATRSLESARSETEQRSRRAQVPWIEALLDLDEALGRAQAMIQARTAPQADPREGLTRELETAFEQLPAWKRIASRSWHQEMLRRLKRREAGERKPVPDAELEGLRILQSRLHRALHEGNVRQVVCVGEIVDPKTMCVVEVVSESDSAPGTVLEEVRPGYQWNTQVIRPAEVKAVAS